MQNLHPTLGLPEDVIVGLQNSTYERVGGVIRESGNKQIVAWLRDATPDVLGTLSKGFQFEPFLGVLNLAVSVVGFSLVLARLKTLEGQLSRIQSTVTSTSRKIDLMMDGQAYSALTQAELAIHGEQPENRARFAQSALDGLLKSQVQVRGFFDDTLKEKRFDSASILYQSLCLIYVAQLLCYLELGETRRARNQTEEHHQILVSLSEQLLGQSLDDMQNPILSETVLRQISWDRIFDLHHWIKPELRTEDLLITLVAKSNAHAIEEEQRRKGAKIEKIRRIVTRRQQVAEETDDPQILQLRTMEAVVEDTRRFESYGNQIEVMLAEGKTFSEWRSSLRSIETPDPTSGFLCYRADLADVRDGGRAVEALDPLG